MEANYFTILYWFCHTLRWIRHGCTCVHHPEPLPAPSHPIWVIPVLRPRVSCIMHQNWTGDHFFLESTLCIIGHFFFSVCLTSISMTISRSVHIAANVMIPCAEGSALNLCLAGAWENPHAFSHGQFFRYSTPLSLRTNLIFFPELAMNRNINYHVLKTL